MPFADRRTPFAARRRRSARPLSSMVVTSRTRWAALPSLIACSQQVSSNSMHAGEISPDTVRCVRCSPSSLSTRNTHPPLHRGLHSQIRSTFCLALVADAEPAGHPTWQAPSAGIVEQGLRPKDAASGPTRQTRSKRLSVQVLLTSHRCDEATESHRHMPISGVFRR